jgi:hypothetical protein
VTVSLSAVDLSSAVREIRYRVGGGPETVIPGPQGGLVVGQEGVTPVTFFAVDEAGNAGAPQTIAARIDRTPPATTAALNGTQGTNGWWRSAVSVALSAIDAGAGVREIHYRVDAGAEVVVAGVAAAFTVSDNGNHTVTFFAVDGAGVAEPQQTVRVSIDASAPTVVLTVNPTSLKANGKPQDVFIGGLAADLPSGVASVGITVTNRAGAVVATLSGFNQKVSLLGTAGQIYTVRAVVTDKAGNVATATRQVTVK